MVGTRLLALALVLTAPAGAHGEAAAEALPQVAITHQGLIERYCASVGEAPDPRAVAAVEPRLAEFAVGWAERGPELMAASVAVTGRP